MPQFDTQQVVRGHNTGPHREFHLAADLPELPIDGIKRRQILTDRDDLPEVGVGLLADLGLGLAQLKAPDLLAQPGQLVAIDDLQSRKQGLHGRHAAHDAALDKRQRHADRPHLGQREGEIGLHESVLGLEHAPGGRYLREIGGEGLPAGLEGLFEFEPRRGERAVMLNGRGTAFIEAEGLGGRGKDTQQSAAEPQACNLFLRLHLL